MKKYIKAYQTINNRSGGLYGLKNLYHSKKLHRCLATLEIGARKVVINKTNEKLQLASIKNSDRYKFKKKNKHYKLSQNQSKLFFRKKNYTLFYKKNMIFLNDTSLRVGYRIFAVKKH